MKDRDTTDVWTAVAIGAVIGIGAALIVRAQQEDDTHEIIKRLRPLRRQAARTTKRAGAEVGRRARQAGEAGEDVVRAGREILDELRSGARDIISETRRELRKAAKQSVKEARNAARRAAREMSR
jgi:gas vesicle protein